MKFIKEYWQFIILIVGLLVLSKMGCHRQDVIDTDLSGAETYSDSLLTDNKIKDVMLFVDSSALIEKQEEIVKLNKEVKKWKRGYSSLSRKLKIALLEDVVGGSVVVNDSLICLNEQQMDSVNIIAKEKDNCLNVLKIANEKLVIKDDMIKIHKSQKENLILAVDTLVNNEKDLRIKLYLKDSEIKKSDKKVKRNRKIAFIAVLVSVLEGFILSL